MAVRRVATTMANPRVRQPSVHAASIAVASPSSVSPAYHCGDPRHHPITPAANPKAPARRMSVTCWMYRGGLEVTHNAKAPSATAVTRPAATPKPKRRTFGCRRAPPASVAPPTGTPAA